MKKLLLVLLLTPFIAFGSEKDQKPGFKEITPNFKTLWNKNDIEGFMKLFHKDSKLSKGWSNPQFKESIKKEFTKMLEAFGKIENMELGKYIDRKDKFVLKVKYTEKGNIPGTMSLSKEGDKWFIKDWNIDGQGEPELKE